MLERACPDDQPVALRLSAARSLQHSGVLLLSGASAASDAEREVAVRAGLVALTLLQDDDDEVREVVSETLIPQCAAVTSASAAPVVPSGFPSTEVWMDGFILC